MVFREIPQQGLHVIGDGAAVRAGIGLVVPALFVGVLLYLLWPAGASISPLGVAAIAFVATGLALAILRAPRIAVIDRARHEIRLTIGWPPLGRQLVIPFADISEIAVWQPIKFGDDRLGYARPALVLTDKSTVFLSTYNRSPKTCREIADQVRALVFAPEG